MLFVTCQHPPKTLSKNRLFISVGTEETDNQLYHTNIPHYIIPTDTRNINKVLEKQRSLVFVKPTSRFDCGTMLRIVSAKYLIDCLDVGEQLVPYFLLSYILLALFLNHVFI